MLREELRTVEPGKQSVLLDKSHAQVQLGHMGGDVEQRWYLDSGASNHMTGSREASWKAA